MTTRELQYTSRRIAEQAERRVSARRWTVTRWDITAVRITTDRDGRELDDYGHATERTLDDYRDEGFAVTRDNS